MKATELRIGNLFRWLDEPDRLLKVSEIRFNHQGNRWVKFENGDGSIIEDEDCMLEPIPLAEEWLVKARFDVKENSSWASGEKQKFKVYSKGNFTYNSIQGLWWYFGKILPNQPKYVHKLQNIYYELADNELEFTL